MYLRGGWGGGAAGGLTAAGCRAVPIHGCNRGCSRALLGQQGAHALLAPVLHQPAEQVLQELQGSQRPLFCLVLQQEATGVIKSKRF